MKNTQICSKRGSRDIVRAPDDARRYLANSIGITKRMTVERSPVARYVCCDCGSVENWVDTPAGPQALRRTFG